MTKAQKIKQIKKLTKQQISLMRQTDRIAKLPPAKGFVEIYRRACKTVAIFLQIRALEMQKNLIISTPTKKFKSGGRVHKGPAIVSDSEKKELIIINNELYKAQ